MGKLFLLDGLIEILETVFYTCRVRDEVPVSIILVGPSGSAKSQLIKSYDEPQIHISDSITSAGIWDIVQNDPAGKKKFICVPDINPTLSRRNATAQATVSNLLSLTSDGTVRVDDGRREKKCQHEPMGLVTACTPEIYDRHARQWYALGLRRRILPIFYEYSYPTVSSLQKKVRENEIHNSPPQHMKLKLGLKPAFPVIGKEEATELERHSLALAINLGKLSFISEKIKQWTVKTVVPISPHVTLRVMAQAHAIRRDSPQVEREDIDFIIKFLQFTDPQNPGVI